MKKKDELPVSICVLGISSHDGNELLLTYYKKREDQIRGGMGSEGEIRGGIRGREGGSEEKVGDYEGANHYVQRLSEFPSNS